MKEHSTVNCLYMISGLTDLQRAGNQSFFNTINYIAKSGIQIHIFSFSSESSERKDIAARHLEGSIKFHRVPSWLSPLIHVGKEMKSRLGRINKKEDINSNILLAPGETVEYFDDHNFLGRLAYVLFFLGYVPIELIRVTYFSRKHKPDVIYGYEVYGAVVAALLGKISNKTVITRFQGTALTEIDLQSKRRKLLLLHHIMALIAPSEAIIMANDGTRGNAILERLGVNRERIHFWMNGLDIDRMHVIGDAEKNQLREELGVNGKHVLIMVSKLKKWKRVDRGIFCIYWLQQKYGLNNIVLLVIGDGSEGESLSRLAEELGVSKRVKFLGAKPYEAVNKYYQIADVFMSLYDVSNLGNPILESLYLETPIVTLEDGSTVGLLENWKSAVLVPLTEIEEELPRRVYQLLSDGRKRIEIAKYGREVFNERIQSWKDRMNMEIELIKELSHQRMLNQFHQGET